MQWMIEKIQALEAGSHWELLPLKLSLQLTMLLTANIP
jgi:hypothetical protein